MFEMATRRARRGLGRRLSQETLETTRALIVSLLQGRCITQALETQAETRPGTNIWTEDDFPPLVRTTLKEPSPLPQRQKKTRPPVKFQNPCVSFEEGSLVELDTQDILEHRKKIDLNKLLEWDNLYVGIRYYT